MDDIRANQGIGAAEVLTLPFNRLVELAHSGDPRATEAVWQALGAHARRALFQAGARGETVEDLFAEVGRLFLRHLDKVEPDFQRAVGKIRLLAATAVKDAARRVSRVRERETEMPEDFEPAMPVVEEPELAETIEALRAKLTAKQTEVWDAWLEYFRGETSADENGMLKSVAQRLDMDAEAVKTQIRRIRSRLRPMAAV
ncbi:MAG: hypothetical protein HONBIEJF_01013 [Fimbriimonadaceae bacterium]|nr:hypothetical protein [Fimbriimonadaceae bacterium]